MTNARVRSFFEVGALPYPLEESVQSSVKERGNMRTPFVKSDDSRRVLDYNFKFYGWRLVIRLVVDATARFSWVYSYLYVYLCLILACAEQVDCTSTHTLYVLVLLLTIFLNLATGYVIAN